MLLKGIARKVLFIFTLVVVARKPSCCRWSFFDVGHAWISGVCSCIWFVEILNFFILLFYKLVTV